jgi:hypothetical protein
VTSATTSTEPAASSVAGTRSAHGWLTTPAIERASSGVNGGWST